MYTDKASSRGLVVKVEDSWPRGPRFKPSLWWPFFKHHSIGSKLGTKIVENSNLLLLHLLYSANGRVDFEEWSAFKIQPHGIEWIVSLSANWYQSPTNKKQKTKTWPDKLSVEYFTQWASKWRKFWGIFFNSITMILMAA